MKGNIHFLFLPVLMLMFTTCKKVDKLTQFNLEYEESVVIPSSTGINLPFNIITPDMASQSESAFALNNTSKDLIEAIKLKKMDLTVTSPGNGTFSFLKSMEIFLAADGLPEVKVAWKDNIPANAGNYLEMDVSGSDLQEYIKKDKFSLKLKTVTDELLATDYTIKVHSVFFVDAKILGQ